MRVARKDSLGNEFLYVEDHQKWIGVSVHVEGWNTGCHFNLLSFDENTGESILCPPKHNRSKRYKTSNRLYHTRKRSKDLSKIGDEK